MALPQQKITLARIYLLLIIIASIGVALGLLSATKKIKKINLPIITNSAVDARCAQKAKISNICSAVGIEFDSVGEKCVVINGAGCIDKLPFSSIAECQKICETGAVSVNELKFETIIKNFNSSHAAQSNYVIKNQSEWIPILQKTNAELPAPIDFIKDMIVAVFQGEKSTGGYDLEINGIIEKENVVEISVIETSPGRGCMVTKMLTSPFHIIKVQKLAKEVVFKIKKIVNDCQGVSPNQDICDIGKGDWGNSNGIFMENNVSLNIAQKKCEEKTDCEWKILGGKITDNFACCPKNLNGIITDENRKFYERCFIIID